MPKKPTTEPDPTQPRCPICARPTEPAFRPFCSRRCANVDLGRWLTGDYRIPGPPADEEAEEPPNPT